MPLLGSPHLWAFPKLPTHLSAHFDHPTSRGRSSRTLYPAHASILPIWCPNHTLSISSTSSAPTPRPLCSQHRRRERSQPTLGRRSRKQRTLLCVSNAHSRPGLLLTHLSGNLDAVYVPFQGACPVRVRATTWLRPSFKTPPVKILQMGSQTGSPPPSPKVVGHTLSVSHIMVRSITLISGLLAKWTRPQPPEPEIPDSTPAHHVDHTPDSFFTSCSET